MPAQVQAFNQSSLKSRRKTGIKKLTDICMLRQALRLWMAMYPFMDAEQCRSMKAHPFFRSLGKAKWYLKQVFI